MEYSKNIQQALDFIEKRLNKDLTLRDIADHLMKSQIYYSAENGSLLKST